MENLGSQNILVGNLIWCLENNHCVSENKLLQNFHRVYDINKYIFKQIIF